MLYFSKLRIILVTLISLFFIFAASNNILHPDKRFFDKKINLGLDLLGGSYLLLEIDNTPVIEQKLQNTITILKTYFKDKKIKIKNLVLDNQKIKFDVDANYKQTVIDIFNDENSDINPYYPRFKSHQFDLFDLGNSIELSFSRQGLVELKTSSRDQA